jgi:hypothetical protein
VSSLPSTDGVDCSYRWRPLRHGRGAEADPAAVPGAAAVSADRGAVVSGDSLRIWPRKRVPFI